MSEGVVGRRNNKTSYILYIHVMHLSISVTWKIAAKKPVEASLSETATKDEKLGTGTAQTPSV